MKKLAVLLLLIQTSVSGQNFNKQLLDAYFDTLEVNNRFMGGVTLMKDGNIVYQKTTGYRDVENNIRSNNDTKFAIGSITKTFTSTLILKAVEDQKLSVDDKLYKWFPQIRNAEKITIADMLYHRSGIHNFTEDKTYLTWNTLAQDKQSLVKKIIDVGVDFEPGTKFSYSNSNYLLLSYILEDVYKTSYKKQLEEKIIKPLGLTNTKYGEKIQVTKNEAFSYGFTNHRWTKERETDMSIPVGAGAIFSTSKDLTVFADALFNGKIVKEESLKKMTTLIDKMGMGMFMVPYYTQKGYGHSGGVDGFSSFFCYFPGIKLGFALTSNGTTYVNNNITIAVLNAFNGIAINIPDFHKKEIKSEELDKYLGAYTSKDIPLKITVTKEGSQLIAQTTGQPSIKLDYLGENLFGFDASDIRMTFKPEEKRFILSQGGHQYLYIKE